MARAMLVVLALLLPVAATGCVDLRPPARSVPLESIAPVPEPIGAERFAVVGYVLEGFEVGAPFDHEWNETKAAEALGAMGWTWQDGAYVQRGELTAHILADVHPDRFWLNVTYSGFDVAARTYEKANDAAEEIWDGVEPHYMATLASFESRTGWTTSEAPTRTSMFAAQLGSG